MEHSSGSNQKNAKGGIPLWLLLVLFTAVILMAVTIAFFILLHFDVIQCGPDKAPEARTVTEATALPDTAEPQQPSGTDEQPQTPDEQPQTPDEQPQTPDGEPTGPDDEPLGPDDEPYEEPEDEPEDEPETPAPIVVEPTAAPTEAPTEAPTPKPTEKPDSFQFGGKKIKAGETKISGKKLGINGKNKKPRHITEEEVKNLVELCPDLEELELEYCSLPDYTPIGKLTKLRKLAFTNCGTGDGNAIKDIGWIKDLTELRRLNLKYNKIEDTEALSGLKKLTYLNLAGNPLTDEDLKPLSNLTNLDTLYLYDLKKITDVSPLAKLSKLTFLHIGHNSKLKNVKPLTKLKKLTQLRLNHTKVSDLSYFKDFSALKKLDVGKSPIPKEQFYHLKDCKKLTRIVLEMSDEDAFYAIVDMIGDGYPFHVQYQWKDD